MWYLRHVVLALRTSQTTSHMWHLRYVVFGSGAGHQSRRVEARAKEAGQESRDGRSHVLTEAGRSCRPRRDAATVRKIAVKLEFL